LGISYGNQVTFTTKSVPPVANFSASKTVATTNESIQFTDLSTNNPTSWLWNFGDGGTSTERNPSHSYTTTGSYTVSLTAQNSAGENTKTMANYIAISQSAVLPSVVTSGVTYLSQTSVTSGGNVTSDGGATVTARGVCWNTTGNPTVADNHTTDGTGTGNYTSTVTGLSAGVTYYIRAYATNSIGTAYGSQMPFSIQAVNGLIAYYPFNGSTNDESGNGNNGISKGSLQYVTGISGTGVRLEGTTTNYGMTSDGDHVLLPAFDFTATNEFTFSLWVKEESLTYWHGTGYIFIGDAYGGNAAIGHFADYNNKGSYIGYSSGATNASLTNDPNHPEFYFINPFDGTNKWVHYALTYKGGTLRAFKDGNFIGSKAQPLKISGSNAAIGRHWWENGKSTATRFTGTIDEVRIYNKALSDDEIAKLYNSK
jgi:PKD repeat protein